MPTYQAPGVYVEEVDSGSKPLSPAGTSVAAFIGFTAQPPSDEVEGPRMVTSWADYQRVFGGFAPGALLPLAVQGFFDNGGGRCYIVRIPNSEPSTEPPALTLRAPAALPAGTTAPGAKKASSPTTTEPDAVPEPLLELTSKIDPTSGPHPALSVLVAPIGGDEGRFNLVVEADGHQVEYHPNLTLAEGEGNAVDTLNANSDFLAAVAGTAAGVPQGGRFPVLPPPPSPLPVTQADVVGDEATHTGVKGLVVQEDVNMVIVPDLVNIAKGEDGAIDPMVWRAVQAAVISHCEKEKNRVAVLDAPPDKSPQQVHDWLASEAMYSSPFAALYYPWIKVADPLAQPGQSPLTLLPPSGHLAGVWARVDESRGVWKAPANEVVLGALDVERPVTKGEQELLNPVGINCIRPFGTNGIRVWGARTLASDASWRYINVRRLFSMIESTIKDGTSWVVFEPNDQALWERVKRTVSAFLTGLWRQGALLGASAAEAFYVKCDAENNPPDVRDLGQLVIEVGIAPVKPAEFVIFRISQWAGPSA